jgi:hypothetical protein
MLFSNDDVRLSSVLQSDYFFVTQLAALPTSMYLSDKVQPRSHLGPRTADADAANLTP